MNQKYATMLLLNMFVYQNLLLYQDEISPMMLMIKTDNYLKLITKNSAIFFNKYTELYRANRYVYF